MIRVTVELISANGPSRNKTLGVATITNTGTGSNTVGNYEVVLSKRAPQLAQVWKRATLHGFPRKRYGAWDLLVLSLIIALGGDRMAELFKNCRRSGGQERRALAAKEGP